MQKLTLIVVSMVCLGILDLDTPICRAEPSAEKSMFGVLSHTLPLSPKEQEVQNPLFKNAGFQWVKFNMGWSWMIEGKKGVFTWETADQNVTFLEKAGLKAVVLLYSTPEWAASSPPGVEAFWKFPPKDISDYGNYVRQVVRRYKGTIKYWEVWNEPNGYVEHDKSWLPIISPAGYTAMLKSTWEAAKGEDSDCKIVGLSYAYGAYATPDFMEEVFKSGGLKYMDIIGIHPYSFEKPGMTFCPPEKNNLLIQKIKETKTLMDKYGGRQKQIWLSEMGWPIGNDAANKGVTEIQQADYLIRMYVLAMSTGIVERVFWYCLMDKDQLDYGLLNKDLSPRTSYRAYSTMTKMLEGARFSGEVDIGEDAYGFRFQTEGDSIHVLWSVNGCRDIVLNTDAETVKLIGVLGDTTDAKSNHGLLKIRICESPVYLLGAPKEIEAPKLRYLDVADPPRQ